MRVYHSQGFSLVKLMLSYIKAISVCVVCVCMRVYVSSSWVGINLFGWSAQVKSM